MLVIKRGGCGFNDKLANIPTFVPDGSSSLQLVIVLSYPEDFDSDNLIRPLLDQEQKLTGNYVSHCAPRYMFFFGCFMCSSEIIPADFLDPDKFFLDEADKTS